MAAQRETLMLSPELGRAVMAKLVLMEASLKLRGDSHREMVEEGRATFRKARDQFGITDDTVTEGGSHDGGST